MLTPCLVRPATPADLTLLASYNERLALETEQRTLIPATVRAGVEAALADAAKGRYFVAEQAGARVGSLFVTTEWSDWRCGTFWWIQSVYVEPFARRRGVFRALYAHVESLARAAPDVCGLRLYVEAHNERAQATYLALGMRDGAYRVFERDYVLGSS